MRPSRLQVYRVSYLLPAPCYPCCQRARTEERYRSVHCAETRPCCRRTGAAESQCPVQSAQSSSLGRAESNAGGCKEIPSEEILDASRNRCRRSSRRCPPSESGLPEHRPARPLRSPPARSEYAHPDLFLTPERSCKPHRYRLECLRP